MNLAWSRRLERASANHGRSAACSATIVNVAIQFVARIATSIVHAQLAPNSTGLWAIQSCSCAPISSSQRSEPVSRWPAASSGRCWKRESSHGTLMSEASG